ncbi:MAG: helix-turn-helix domain-containing protein [Lachnospiraceae bacterium]|nr:helix-turn-helix domain-containing protein [Lachnospiraceae bacterium]
MSYHSELAFTEKILSHFRLKTRIVTEETFSVSNIDLGLRQLLGFEEIRDLSHFFIHNKMKSNTIYKLTDNFYCNYFILRLPETAVDTYWIAGPYTTRDFNHTEIMEFTEKYSLPPAIFNTLEKFFNNIPYLENESMVLIVMNTLGESLWGSLDHFTFETLEQIPENTEQRSAEINAELSYEQTDASVNMKAIEERYAVENQLLQAVSQGLNHKVELLMTNITASNFEKRTSDPIRNMQNYCIIMNTLLRKAVENGSVHPFYIDKLSSDFARKIEQVTTMESVRKLQKDMMHKYCLLVKNHSMKGYSPLIQKIITTIDTDLTADLSLNTLASRMNVNASYLSTLFKRETGSTLTDYVNEKRIQHGILLLHSTNLQIQTIASYCGIPDVNYFTKLFKKRVGKTPKAYRELFLKGGKKV